MALLFWSTLQFQEAQLVAEHSAVNVLDCLSKGLTDIFWYGCSLHKADADDLPRSSFLEFCNECHLFFKAEY
jgi:hypothetical protein